MVLLWSSGQLGRIAVTARTRPPATERTPSFKKSSISPWDPVVFDAIDGILPLRVGLPAVEDRHANCMHTKEWLWSGGAVSRTGVG